MKAVSSVVSSIRIPSSSRNIVGAPALSENDQVWLAISPLQASIDVEKLRSLSGIPRNESTESPRDQQEEEDVHTTEMTRERTADESAAVRSGGGGG